MSKEYVTARKMSAIVALALAVLVSFAAINSYGDSKNSEDFIVYDVEESIERAYNDVTEEYYTPEIEEVQNEIIKIYNQEFELVKSLEIDENGVIGDEEAKKLMNRADFLSSYGNTSVYKIAE